MRCDQQRLPADPLEAAILAEVLAALDDGSIFQAAGRAQQAWHAQHPGRQAELAGVRATLAERRAAIDRYPRTFEAQRLPESICADRLAELDREVRGLEARAAALEAECDVIPRWPRTTFWPESGAGSSGPSLRAPPSSSSSCWTRWSAGSWWSPARDARPGCGLRPG